MKSIFLIVFISTILYSQSFPDSVITHAGHTSMRSSPSRTAQLIVTIPPSTKVRLIEKTYEGGFAWYKVEYLDQVGWLIEFFISMDSFRVIPFDTEDAGETYKQSYDLAQKIMPYAFFYLIQPPSGDLTGLVRSVQIAKAKLSQSFGEWTEVSHQKSDSIVYNPKGLKVYEKTKRYFGDSFRTVEYSYEYDGEDRIALGRLEKPLLITWIAKYDGEQNDDTVTTLGSTGSVLGYNVIHRDESENILKIDVFDDGQLVSRSIWDRDTSNRREKISSYNKLGELESVITISSDARGRPLENINYEPDGRMSMKTTYQYLPQQEITEFIMYDEDGSVSSKSISTKDSIGRIIHMKDEHTSPYLQELLGGEYSYTYEYDDHSNWIKQIKSEKVVKFGEEVYEPVEATYRRITYYPE